MNFLNQEDFQNKFIGEKYIADIVNDTPFIVENKIIGHPFDLEKLINKFGKEIIPNKLGIYHLFFYDQLVYIGMSKNIRGRLLMHLKDQDMHFNYCLWFTANLYSKKCKIKDILEIEYKMIKKFKPVLNSLHANCR